MVTNQSSNRVQCKMLITSFLLRLLAFVCFEMGSCCVVLAGLVPMAVLQALGFQPCLSTPTCVTFSLLISHMWKIIRGPCVELPRTDNILNFFKIPRCLCMRYFLPGPFKLCVLALAELLSNATSVSACHSCLLFILLKWFGFYEISQWHQDLHLYMDIYLSCSFVICLYF